MLGAGGQERGLIETDGPRCAEARQVIDTRAAVIAHRGHRRVPRHPEVPGGLGHGMLRRPDPPADLRPGSFAEHGPRGDLIGLL
jgi:hypothetical protein